MNEFEVRAFTSVTEYALFLVRDTLIEYYYPMHVTEFQAKLIVTLSLRKSVRKN